MERIEEYFKKQKNYILCNNYKMTIIDFDSKENIIYSSAVKLKSTKM